jgi:bifunctional non-homologous end joining protein LigD
MVFDLDPGEGTSIVECCKVAGLIVEILEAEGAEVVAKTSGMKGLQLYTPVSARSSWDAVRERAHGIAVHLEKEQPQLVVSRMNKSLRRGRVLIDWSQNHPAKTTICAYSVRPASFPSVSAPVTLDEVRACADRADPSLLRFDTADVLRRVDDMGDLMALLDRTRR